MFVSENEMRDEVCGDCPTWAREKRAKQPGYARTSARCRHYKFAGEVLRTGVCTKEDRILSDYEKFDLILKRIDETDAPEHIKNSMRMGAIKAYERSNRTGEKIALAEKDVR